MAVAREQVAGVIGARTDEVVCTGTGSEADLLALRGYVLAGPAGARHPRRRTGHRASRRARNGSGAGPSTRGCRLTVLPVDGEGLIDPDLLATALDVNADRRLVSIMLANNETGEIQPVGELARIAHTRGVVVHCDAAQACGKIPVDVDLLTVVGHKMYAPRGAAAVYVRRTVSDLEPVAYGGCQERGLRAGTENVAMAVALGEAAVIAAEELVSGVPERIAALRDDLHHRLDAALPGRGAPPRPTKTAAAEHPQRRRRRPRRAPGARRRPGRRGFDRLCLPQRPTLTDRTQPVDATPAR